MVERTAPRVRLLDYGFLSFYRKQDIPITYKCEDRAELFTIAKRIWSEVGNSLVDKEGGVVLDRIGYLVNWMTPVKRVFKTPYKGKVKLNTNFHSNNFFYNTSLFTDIFKRSNFVGWSIDKSLSSKLKKKMNKNLKKGLKYKFYYTFVKNLYNVEYLKKLE